MEEEYNSMIENNTWELVPLLSNMNLVRCNWTFKKKRMMMDTLQIIRLS
jgi:hypothetical protein